MALLKQSTARVRTFLLVLTSDHLTGATGASPTVTISKNGAAFGAAAGAVAELTSGWYTVSFTTVDTATLGDLAVHVTGTAADPSDWSDEVVVDVPGGAVASVTGAVGSVTGAVGSVTGAVGSVTGAVGSVTGAVGSVTGNVGGNVVGSVASVTARVTANTDQLAGQTVTAGAGVTFPSSVASPTNITGGVITTVTNLTNLPSIPANWITAAGITAAALNGKGDWNIGKTGYALSAAGVQAIWDALTSALTTVGSIGKLLVDNLNATISSVKALLPAALVGGRIDASVGAMAAGVQTSASFATSSVDANALATDAVTEIVAGVLAGVVEGTTTVQQSLRLANSALGGKSSGHATGAPVYRDLGDATDRITATTDADGNRTAVVRSL